MPKISRRKQSKPQHICGDDSSDGTEVNNGPIGKDTVEDNNANIVVTEDKVDKSNNDTENQTDNDIIPLHLEAEDDDDDCNLKLDESDDKTNFDSDSNYSYDQSVDNEPSDKAHLHTPNQNDRMCDFCGAIKKSPSDLARHLLKHTGEHPFKCEHCDKAFKSKRSLQHHQHSVHGISLAVSMVAIDASIPLNRKRKSDESVASNSSPESEIKKVKSEPDLYNYPSMVYAGDTCTQGQMFLPESSGSFMGSFKFNQLPTKSSPEESNNRTCQVCGKVCSKPSDLKRHMMSHTGERPFRCNICGKAFRAKNSMFYHQKSSHGLNIELSPGLQERFMKLKKQNRLNTLVNPQTQSTEYGNEESKDSNDHQMSSSLLLQKLGQKVRCASNSVLYSYDINSHQEGEVELDENTGLFKQSGSIFNKPLVTADRIKPEPLKLKNSMVGMQIVQESHNIKRHICVKNETVLVTRLDGVDVLTAKDISLYKCYLCGRLFDDLLKIQCHLSTHFQKELTLYRCQLCEDTFWFKFRVINHIRKNHPKEARRVLKKFEEEEKSKSKEMEDENEAESNEMKMETENQSEDCEKNKTDENESESKEKEDENKEDKQTVKNSHDIMETDTAEDEKFDNEPSEKGQESTSTEAEENPENKKPDIDSKTTSKDNTTKDTSLTEPVAELHDLTHRRKKPDPFVNLYKGIRFKKKPNGSFICLLCRKSFYKEFALLQHIKIHNQQDICYCEECGEGFMEYGKLRFHITTLHKAESSKTASPSATAKNSLLSSLLSKTTQWHRPPVILPNQSESHLEKAREILQKEGIQDDVTVVLPSEPDEEKTTESRKANLDSILSHQESEKFVENDTEESEIHLSPKRLLMTKLLSKSKRKSSQPVKLENPESLEEMDIEKMRSDTERETISVKQEPAEEVQESKAPCSIATSLPILNSELMAAKLNNLAMLHPGIHPVVMANTLATLAAQGLPITTQGMFLPGSKLFPGISPAYPLIGIPASLNSASFVGSLPQMPATIDIPTSQPVSVEIPKPADDNEESVTVKQEPPSPVDNSNSNHSSITSNDPSPNLSGSESGERERLVGFPRVQWNGSESESELIEGNPSNLPSSLQHGWGYSSDGRKVTSLSRTHSRLPIVSTPVDREKICKPTVLADGRTVFRCPFCSKDFLSYSDINRHMDFHEDIRPFKCKFCEYYARTNSQLKVHMMRHQGIREFCCRLCNYKGVTQSDLNRHMKSQIHLLKSKHACHHCDEGFVTPRNLERHLDGNCIVKMQKLENGEVV